MDETTVRNSELDGVTMASCWRDCEDAVMLIFSSDRERERERYAPGQGGSLLKMN